jgi:hypothetical protein
MTYRGLSLNSLQTSLASFAALLLSPIVCSSYPYSCNLNKLLPKVLVSMQSAPAARYCLCIVFIHSGRVRVRPSLKPSFLFGKSSACGDNFWISVPIAPSKRITLLFKSSNNENIIVSRHSLYHRNFTFVTRSGKLSYAKIADSLGPKLLHIYG